MSSSKDKLIKRVQSVPADLKWSELIRFMRIFNYEEFHSGSGSHRKFINRDSGKMVNSCKPHNPEIVQRHIIKQILNHLEENGALS